MRARLLIPLLFLFMLCLPSTGSAALILGPVVSTPTFVSFTATWTNPDPGSVLPNVGAPNWDVDLVSFRCRLCDGD